MKLGDLTVVLKAITTDFTKNVSKASEHIEKLARQVKRAANEMAQAGLGMAAVAAGAVALAATVDPAINAQLKDLKNAFADLAVPIAQLVVPAMRDLANAVRMAADFIAGLSPHAKSMIMHFIEIAAIVGAAALVVSKLAAAFEAIAGIIGLITAGPLLPVLAVVAALAAAAVFLHKVWRENWGGIQELVKRVATNVKGYLVQAFEAATDVLASFVRNSVDGFIALINGAQTFAKALGVTNPALDSAADFTRDIANWTKSLTTGGGLRNLVTDAVATANTLKSGLLDAAGAFGAEMKIIAKEIGSALGGFPSLGSATRHGGQATANVSSGMEGVAAMSAASREAAEGASAAGLAKRVSENSAFVGRALKIAAAERARIENTFIGQLGKLGEGVRAAVPRVLSKLGDAGQIAGAAMEGMATGGPWGAVIAVVVELASRMSSFMKMVEYFNGNLAVHLERLSSVFEPLFEVMQTLSESVDTLTEAFPPIQIAFDILKGVFWVIGKSVIGVSIAVLEIAKWITEATFGDSSSIKTQLAKLREEWDKPFTPAKTLGESMTTLAAKVNKTADKFSELLTNLPSGYKGFRAAQFAADSGMGAGNPYNGMPGGGFNPYTGGAPKTPPPTTINIQNMNVAADDAAELQKELDEIAREARARKGRNPE